MFNEIMAENVQKADEIKEIYPISGQKGKITTAPLDDLWKDTQRRNDRI
jgi:hypothetical protein